VREKQIEIRWRDVDAYLHVNNAVYATYLEEGRDEWLEDTLGDVGSPWDYVLARVAIEFRRELRLEDDAVLVSPRADRKLEPDPPGADTDARRRARGRVRGGARCARP